MLSTAWPLVVRYGSIYSSRGSFGFKPMSDFLAQWIPRFQSVAFTDIQKLMHVRFWRAGLVYGHSLPRVIGFDNLRLDH